MNPPYRLLLCFVEIDIDVKLKTVIYFSTTNLMDHIFQVQHKV